MRVLDHAKQVVPVVMAKAPVPGQVKTRLIPHFGQAGAARIHEAMLRCVIERVNATWPAQRRVLAMAQLDQHRNLLEADPLLAGWDLLDQGEGDLGQRMVHVWQQVGGDTAVAMLGVDAPDVPGEALRAIRPALGQCPVAVGPVSDGGYWTLAASALEPGLFQGIDWGSPSVYDQTLKAAARAGLCVAELPTWHDVDQPEDVQALIDRLGEGEATQDAPRIALFVRLQQLHMDMQHD